VAITYVEITFQARLMTNCPVGHAAQIGEAEIGKAEVDEAELAEAELVVAECMHCMSCTFVTPQRSAQP
jgi:hypothetical protein